MKLVRENIFEKFSEHSDPVRDLGIGAVRVYYFFYISEWAENRLIDFNNPDHIKLLDWLKFHKAVNNYNSKELYEAKKLCKKAGLLYQDSIGDYHTPRMSRNEGPDIMLRVSSANSEDHLFDKGIYQEWVWNFYDISSDPADHYKTWAEIKAKLKESINEKFDDQSDPIKDMNIGEAGKFEKAFYDFILSGFEGFYSDLNKIVAKGSVITIDWSHDPYEDNFRNQIKSSLKSSGFIKYVNIDAISKRKNSTFSSQVAIPLKSEYWYILDGIESIEKKRVNTSLHFKDRWGHTYEIKINWK